MNEHIQECVILDLTFHIPGMTRRGNMDEMETSADKTFLHLSKDIVKSAAYREVHRIAGTTRNEIERRWALPSRLKRGTYRVPRALLPEVYAYLWAQIGEFNEASDAFMEAYPGLVEQAKARLNGQFREQDYPSEDYLAKAFKVDYDLLAVADASPALVGEVIDEAERGKRMLALRRDVEEIKLAVRECAKRVFTTVANGLGEKQNGAKAAVLAQSWESLQQFLAAFADRNVVGDDEMTELVSKVKDVLAGVDHEDTKADSTRAVLKPALDKIAAEVARLAEESGKRMIDLE
ncbi:MAG: hypothetical protein ABIL09_15265 [Gemmatimonadota bacterium]